jgi:hypothetical protein
MVRLGVHLHGSRVLHELSGPPELWNIAVAERSGHRDDCFAPSRGAAAYDRHGDIPVATAQPASSRRRLQAGQALGPLPDMESRLSSSGW